MAKHEILYTVIVSVLMMSILIKEQNSELKKFFFNYIIFPVDHNPVKTVWKINLNLFKI